MSTRATFKRRARTAIAGERGLALPLALGVAVVLAIMVTAVADYTFSNVRNASNSQAGRLAYAAAEAGLNDAISRLLGTGSIRTKNFTDPTTPTTLISNSRFTVGYLYTTSFVDPTWTVTATGTVQNVTGGTRPVTKILTRKLTISTAATQGSNMAVWNFLYSDQAPGSNCMTLSNSVQITTPLYVRGDLCLQNTASVVRNDAFTSANPTTPQLQVGGRITLANSSHIGDTTNAPSKYLGIVQTGQGCGSTPHNPCNASDHVYANQYLATVPSLTKPVIDLATWYRDAYPGPLHACTNAANLPVYNPTTRFFDNDGVQNASLGNANLFPATGYDCQFSDGAGNLIGEIKWTPGTPAGVTGTLLVNGTFFFDGNLSMANTTQVVYQGRGTIYVAGTISFANSAFLCGAPSGGPSQFSSCTSPGWDTTNNMLVLVAGSNATGSGSPAVNFQNSALFQGAVEANGDVNEQNSVGLYGAIIAHQIFVANSVVDTYIPFGMPVPGQPGQSGPTESLVLAANGFSG